VNKRVRSFAIYVNLHSLDKSTLSNSNGLVCAHT